MPTEKEIDRLAQIVWAYHLMHQPLQKSDAIFVLCSYDIRVARYGAELFLDGWAPLLIFSGNVGALTEGMFARSEAEAFGRIAIEMGVPAANILLETEATNTGENVKLTRTLLEARGLAPERFILVQKPFMERRTAATFMANWPGKPFVVTSPSIAYADYPTERFSKTHMINVMLGDLQRIREYPKLGYQVEQEIPADVWDAFEQLVAWGYDKHLIQQA